MPPKKKAEPKAATKKAASKKSSVDDVTDFLNEAKKVGVYDDVKQGIQFISTGSWIIDRVIGDGTGTGAPGGIPRGCMTEIFGDESCGKTTLSLHTAKTVLDEGGRVLFVDFEHSLRAQANYLKNLGIDASPPNFIYLRPNSYEEGAMLAGKAVVQFKPDLIIIDSLAAAIPKAAAEGDAGEGIQIGLHAKLTSNFLNFLSKRLMNNNSALIILNQKRTNIKTSQYQAGPAELTAGGKAIRYYTHVRLEMKTTSNKEEVNEKSNLTGVSEKKAVNQEVKVTAVKNKVDMPWRSAPVFMAFGKGIDGLRSKISLAIAKNVIKKNGAWFKHESKVDPEFSFNVNGMAALYDKLSESPEIMASINPLLMPTIDTDEQQEYKSKGLASDEIDISDPEDAEDLAALGAELGEDLGGIELNADELI